MFHSVGYRPVGLRSYGSPSSIAGPQTGPSLATPWAARIAGRCGRPREQALDEARRGPDRLGGGLERYSAQNRVRVTDTPPPSRSRLG